MEQSEIADVIGALVKSHEEELLAMSPEEIANEWHWRWDVNQSAEWNTYQFSGVLELQKGRWRRWEEFHNGHVFVVERVRDKYVMPRVREFLAALREAEQIDGN